MIGISKQAHYKRIAKLNSQQQQSIGIIEQAREIRKRHTKLGCRKLYSMLAPSVMGRDQTERLLLNNGFRVPRKRSFTRTTYAGRVSFPNRISGLKVTDILQLWVSDITYIPIDYKRHYYLTMILDVYSRRIVGWALSKNMTREETVLKAYTKATKPFNQDQLEGLIFHSDRGGQYGGPKMEAHHQQLGVLPSMGNKAWENAHAESINGIMKNEYINFAQTGIDLNTARKMIKEWIFLYNNERPHGSLNNMNPKEFETYVEQLAAQHKPIETINY
jgi:transposase InsO family protein